MRIILTAIVYKCWLLYTKHCPRSDTCNDTQSHVSDKGTDSQRLRNLAQGIQRGPGFKAGQLGFKDIFLTIIYNVVKNITKTCTRKEFYFGELKVL